MKAEFTISIPNLLHIFQNSFRRTAENVINTFVIYNPTNYSTPKEN
jgi:hypothetical protein